MHQMWQAHTPIPVARVPSARFPSTHFRAYGLGWSLSDYQGRKVVGHGGGYDGMNSHVLMVPEEKIGVVVLTNSLTPIASMLAYRAVAEFQRASFHSLRNFAGRVDDASEVVLAERQSFCLPTLLTQMCNAARTAKPHGMETQRSHKAAAIASQ